MYVLTFILKSLLGHVQVVKAIYPYTAQRVNMFNIY